MKPKEDAHKRSLKFPEDGESKKKFKTDGSSESESESVGGGVELNPEKMNEAYNIYVESQKGRNIKYKDNKEYVEYLKKEARRKYLAEREKEKLDITKKLLDDELLMSSIKLEGKEKKDFELSKKLYDIASENVKLRESIAQENYYDFQDEKEKNKSKVIPTPGVNDSTHYNYDDMLLNKGIVKFGAREQELEPKGELPEFIFEGDMISRNGLEKEESTKGKSKKNKRNEKRVSFDMEGEEETYNEIDEKSLEKEEGLIQKKKKKKKGDEEKGEEKPMEMNLEALTKNGLNDVVKFVHLDSLYNVESKEKELQRLCEEMQMKKEKKMKKIISDRKRLPIYTYRYDILKAIKNNKILVLVGETGSGKSTQLTQYLHECKYHVYGNIICTQPRRIACIAIANRVAEEMNSKLGREVGYIIRFQNKTSEVTKIIYMTDGMFLRLLLYNPTLEGVSVLIIDEAHERSLHTDIIFPIVKDLCTFRENIRVIISSATLDAEKISAYFNSAPIFYVPGRKYNVDIYYTISNESNYLSAIVITILQIHITQPPGDVLVFLPGQFEIEIVQEELENKLKELAPTFRNLVILPIYSALPVELQSRIFEDVQDFEMQPLEMLDMPNPQNTIDENGNIIVDKKSQLAAQRRKKMRRKIILSTNICETSITIENIVYVIDSGLSKQKVYNPNTGMESLITIPCSKASAHQRTGRAGRKQEGKCFRLFTKKAYIELGDNCVPEIQRCEISSIILLLKSLGMEDIINFDFLDPPAPVVIIKGLELLYALGALNDEGALTKTGRKMAEFPTDVKSSKMILAASEKYNCLDEILTITAMLTHANNIFFVQKKKEKEAEYMRKLFSIEGGGDFLLFLNVFKQCEENNFSASFCHDHFLQYHTLIKVKDIKTQLYGICEKIDLKMTSSGIQSFEAVSNIKKCIMSGFFTNSALPINKKELKIIKLNQIVSIYPNSVLSKSDMMEGNQNLCVLFYEVIRITKSFIRYNIPVNKDLLFEMAPFYFYNKGEEGETPTFVNTQIAVSNRKGTPNV